MIFVNSRRMAERMAGALNDLAGAEVALAHHGSVARDKRQEMEDRLKRGTLPAIVATSSLELGIDMGSVDLVVQIEAPPSIASGLQRIGRASHQVGGVPKGVMFPKHRGDLLGVFPAGGNGTQRGVGELDEEMVFESRQGDVFVLGASSWRIEEITQDKVMVSPAPGEPGKMPFWHGDRPGRPLEFGMHVGRISRELARAPKPKALDGRRGLGRDERAAGKLLQQLNDRTD